MFSRRSRSAGMRKHVEAVVEVGAEFLLLNQCLKLAIRGRDQTHIGEQRPESSRGAPTRVPAPPVAVSAAVRAVIRRSRPGTPSRDWRVRNGPRCEIAPVEAPRSCWNNPPSSRPVEIAAQLTFTRGEFLWKNGTPGYQLLRSDRFRGDARVRPNDSPFPGLTAIIVRCFFDPGATRAACLHS